MAQKTKGSPPKGDRGDWLKDLLPSLDNDEKVQKALQRGDFSVLGEELKKLKESIKGELIRT